MDFPQARSTKEEQHRLAFDSLESLVAPSEIHFEPYYPNQRSSFPLVYSLIVSLLVIVLLCGIAVLEVQDPRCSQQENVLEQSYSSDRRFMTLDHQYDHLWDSHGDKAHITIPDPVIAGQELAAGITM